MRTRLMLAAGAAVALAGYGLREVSAADGPNFATWEGYLGGADSSQYSSLKQINKNNVKQLQQVWTYPAPNGGNVTPTVGEEEWAYSSRK
jgi:quinoprotein glucose dehydrogenase